MRKQLNRIRLIMAIGLPKKQLFIYILRRYMELVKECFVAELTQENEVLIPSKLSQDNLPIHFRYYDPIFQII